MNVLMERLKSGILLQNPIFVQIIGMCPSLAVTSSVANGLGLGVASTLVLLGSNVAISSIKNFVPDKIRIPCFIIVIATFVTVIQMLMKGYFPALNASLGVFVPLIVVNCIILARAEAYASKNSVLHSLWDGLGFGLGFTVALLIISAIREMFGNGTLLGWSVFPQGFQPALLLVLAPGAFLVIGLIMAVISWNNLRLRRVNRRITNPSGCAH
ncbi:MULTISPECIES: electron transport complex subunit RsxE [Jonquetella]|uniref:Ion-translocating oxidoreductase complex subunit E n=1 Tax=Jonquetella anthropi DSM 22815 TaxID=885272 RepID=H0UM84_9BACT|nr:MULTISPECIES: electron transport complex subunit E [Jonquetella]EHM13660.1 electron transport complex, RnfABCDGE type, E subunit [Jonquetella anthropi DSM 22815]ERL24381.1 electron transport complex, RnfABCDGE type, E subunit [Jonquetella sp. BV3C21]